MRRGVAQSRSGAALAVLLAVLAGGRARANDGDHPPPAKGVARAAEAYEEGKRLYKLQRYAEALHDFEDAYLANPDPQYLFLTAECHRMLEHWDKAARAYRTFLQDSPDDPERAEVERQLRAVEARIRQPAPVAPVAPAPRARVTRVDLRGALTNEDKQRRCDQVLWGRGWTIHRAPALQAVLVLERDENELLIYRSGAQIERRVLGQEPVERLCAAAIDGIEEAWSAAGAPVRRAPPPAAAPEQAPGGPPPSERDLLAAIQRQQKLLDECRRVYAAEVSEVVVRATVAGSGAVSAVELEGADNASRFANCLARIVRQVALPPFRGPSVVLRPTLPFTPR